MSDAALPLPDDVAVPDLAEPIVAYRGWRVDEDGVLWSPMFRARWPVDEPLQARCHPDAVMPVPGRQVRPPPVHRAPCPIHQTSMHPGHGCGIYGVTYRPSPPWAHDVLLGEVWLSGTVFEYSEGYRAARATPKALWRVEDDDAKRQLVEEVAERYGIPIIEPPEPSHAVLRLRPRHLARPGLSSAAFRAGATGAGFRSAYIATRAVRVQSASVQINLGPLARDMLRRIERGLRASRRRLRRRLSLWMVLCAANTVFILVGGWQWSTPLSALAAGFSGFHVHRTYRELRPLTKRIGMCGVDDDEEEDEDG